MEETSQGQLVVVRDMPLTPSQILCESHFFVMDSETSSVG